MKIGLVITCFLTFLAEIYGRKCIHKLKPRKRTVLGSKLSFRKKEAYAQSAEFKPFRMFFDYTHLLENERKLLKELIIPPIKQFFEEALSVRRYPGKVKLPKGTTSCEDISVPDYLLKEGVDADIIIILSSVRGLKSKDSASLEKNTIIKDIKEEDYSNIKNPDPLSQLSARKDDGSAAEADPDSGVVGWSYKCAQEVYSMRPIAGVMQYVADLKPTKRAIEEAIWTTIHEFSHILAFDLDMFSDFVDSNLNSKPYRDTIKLKTKLKGLGKLMKDRQAFMDDFIKFASFKDPNSTSDKPTPKPANSPAPKPSTEPTKPAGSSAEPTKPASKPKSRLLVRRVKESKRTHSAELPIDLEVLKHEYKKQVSTDSSENLEDILSKMTVSLPVTDSYSDIELPLNTNFTTVATYVNNFIENTVISIKTPAVLRVAREHFNCPSIDRVDLEMHGGFGSAFSHWSKKILNTEYMIADSYGENYVSKFSLALMEDSGWYKVDYSKAEEFKWGKNRGCDFVDKKCFSTIKQKNKTIVETFPEFCSSFPSESCSNSHVFRGVCVVTDYKTALPKEFQYFPDAHYGGVDPFGDYCPYPIEWMGDNYTFPFGSCRNGVSVNEELGEKVCEDCRCFESSLIPNGQSSKQAGKNRAACYQHKCKKENGEVNLYIYVNGQEIKCPRKGGVLTLDSFDGNINCPKSTQVCYESKEDQGFSSTSKMLKDFYEKLSTYLYEVLPKIV